MKIRTILPIVSSLSAFAVPALAQDAAADKAPQAEEPKAAEAPKPEAAAAPAPAAKTEATATVDMGGNATTAAPKRNSLAASPVTRGGNESSEASKEWKTDFHGYFRVPFRLGIGSRPAPKLALPIGASQSEKTETSMGSDFDTTQFVGLDFDDPALDLEAIVRGFGAATEQLTDPGDASAVIARSVARRGPTVVFVERRP